MTDTLPPAENPVCHYQLVVPLSEALQEAILTIRETFYGRYKLPLPLLPPPSLTVLRCAAYEAVEEKLLERLQQVASRIQPFSISLRNFQSSANTICIPLADTMPFHELEKELRAVRSLCTVPGSEVELIGEPSVLVTAGLKPFQFIRMWMDCEHQPFTGACPATGMLLQKQVHGTSEFSTLRQFVFSAASLQTKQGVLFG